MLDSDILLEYLNECEENLERVNLLLTKLEKEGFDQETLRCIGRDVHTVKGSSQLFGFNQLARVTHAIEDCLARLGGAAKDVLPEIIESVYRALDVTLRLFKVLKATHSEPPPSDEVRLVVEQLEALAKKAASGAVAPKPAQPTGVNSVMEGGRAAPVLSAIPPATPLPSDPLTTATLAAESPVPKAAGGKPASPSGGDDGPGETIRVHVGLLDNLMNLVGELVLIRNQLSQVARGIEHESLARVTQRLNVVTSELQDDVMKTRMQPIGNLLNKFQRVVRDMAKDLGKRVELELSGTETELDKTLIEAVRDPLTHIVRNAIDHGLEMPDERKRLGKREAGKLAIRAFHESGQVIVEIKDDGRGLNRDRIAAKAVERGLVTAESIARLTDRDIYQFIFLPGFSTAEKVSNLSGRGVGMDVVRTNIERIGGTVELTSRLGQGTSLVLKVPLTLAIIPALIVNVGDQKFAIPQVKLLELLRVDSDPIPGRGLEMLQGRPVYRLRGNLLPIVSLAEVLQLAPQPAHTLTPSQVTTDEQLSQHHDVNIAVLSVDRHTFGLVIDSIDDSADIVVKPLANFIKDLGAYSGATILGDGSVALTLDIGGIAGLAKLTNDHADAGQSVLDGASSELSAAARHLSDNTEYLVVEIDRRGKYVLPLCLVNRLEEFKGTDICLSGEQRVVKYRGSLLPVISVYESLGFARRPEEPSHDRVSVPVVVVKRGERHYGLEVATIVDVILSAAKIDTSVRDREGILGTFIEGADVYALIDAFGLIDRYVGVSSPPSLPSLAMPRQEGSESVRRRRQKCKILLAEDGSFFRRYISQILLDAGYQVRAECDGALAFAALESEPEGTFAAIISDIEMPGMNGLEFVQKVRSTSGRHGLPMIALSSRFSDADVKQGLNLGFSRYIEKLNPEELLAEVDTVLGLQERVHHAG